MKPERIQPVGTQIAMLLRRLDDNAPRPANEKPSGQQIRHRKHQIEST